MKGQGVSQKKIPQRRCVGCGEMKDKKSLVRVIRTEDGETKVDPTGRANGRGAYLCRNRECLEKALKTKSLERSLKAPVSEETRQCLIKEFADA